MNKPSLETIFKDPKLGYRGLSGMIKVAREFGYSPEEIRNFYYNKPITQLFDKSEVMTNVPYSNKHPGRIQVDLVDISLFKQQNKGMKWILTGIDVQTRVAFAFPMMNKTPYSVLPHLKKIR